MNSRCPSIPNPVESVRQVLLRYPAIRLAVLFGSLVKGNYCFDSDLDVAVGMERPLGMAEKMELIGELAEATGRPVDLVDFSTAGEPLLGQILSGGQKILGEDADYAKVLCRHLFEQADFMPYRQRILEERRRKWIGL